MALLRRHSVPTLCPPDLPTDLDLPVISTCRAPTLTPTPTLTLTLALTPKPDPDPDPDPKPKPDPDPDPKPKRLTLASERMGRGVPPLTNPAEHYIELTADAEDLSLQVLDFDRTHQPWSQTYIEHTSPGPGL